MDNFHTNSYFSHPTSKTSSKTLKKSIVRAYHTITLSIDTYKHPLHLIFPPTTPTHHTHNVHHVPVLRTTLLNHPLANPALPPLPPLHPLHRHPPPNPPPAPKTRPLHLLALGPLRLLCSRARLRRSQTRCQHPSGQHGRHGRARPHGCRFHFCTNECRALARRGSVDVSARAAAGIFVGAATADARRGAGIRGRHNGYGAQTVDGRRRSGMARAEDPRGKREIGAGGGILGFDCGAGAGGVWAG